LACAWAAVFGTSSVNKSASMLHTEVGSSVSVVALLRTENLLEQQQSTKAHGIFFFFF